MRTEDESTSKPAPEERSAAAGLSDPERWVELHGDYLFSYAMMKLRDQTTAEDMVQETFLAALRGRKTFAGRSAEKSWLVGILKNKICDHFRKAGRETSFTDMNFYADEEDQAFSFDGLMKNTWQADAAPRNWAAAGEGLDKAAFWRVYQDCSKKMPEKVGAVFMLREVDGVESREICAMLNISEGNLWVMLHRARLALRRCMEVNWFGGKERLK